MRPLGSKATVKPFDSDLINACERWLAVTGTTLAAFVSLWYRALAAAPAIDVTAVLVAGAVVTAILNTGFRGAPVTVDGKEILRGLNLEVKAGESYRITF